ncbi:ABC transporter ATP-binding protein [Acidobacteria bacterium AB60]|nr:ABC transporter ATP-binding protein [Acidobacteria bacterium AB60]
MIECRALKKAYAAHPVLRGVDLAVEPGICAVLGRNGAGKSTLLRTIAGLERPDSGSVHICGMTFDAQGSEIRKRLGCVPEDLALFESLTMLENLRAVGPIYGLSRRATESRAEELLALFELTQGRHTPARKGSFGMRKKTALAMALLHKPDILLLDEPFEGIDPTSSNVIQTLLRQLAKDGTTILLTSHLLSLVEAVADRVIILHEGMVALDADPARIAEGVERAYFSVVGRQDPEVPGWLRL